MVKWGSALGSRTVSWPLMTCDVANWSAIARQPARTSWSGRPGPCADLDPMTEVASAAGHGPRWLYVLNSAYQGKT